MSNKNYIVNAFRKILKEDLEEKAESLMNKLDYNKTLKLNKDNEFDYVQEEDNMEGSNMCESCGGEMNEGECSECGNMYEIDLQELGGMDDGHPRFGKTKFKNQMTNDEIEKLLRGDDDADADDDENDYGNLSMHNPYYGDDANMDDDDEDEEFNFTDYDDDDNEFEDLDIETDWSELEENEDFNQYSNNY